MDRNIAIQYTAVGIIIIAALAWLVIKFFKQRKKGGHSQCCGCSLSENCKSPAKDRMKCIKK